MLIAGDRIDFELRLDFEAEELAHLEDPERTEAWGWFVRMIHSEKSSPLIWT